MLGNIAGDSTEARDELLRTDLLEHSEEILGMPMVLLELLRIVTWLTSNLFKGSPLPVFDRVKCIIPRAWNLLHVTDTEVVKNALYIFCYATCGDQTALQSILTNINVGKIASFLTHKNTEISRLAVRILGNFCTGPASMSAEVLETNCLPAIKAMISSKSEITHDACWMISNIVAGPLEHIQKIIDADIIPESVDVVHSSLSNAVSNIRLFNYHRTILGDQSSFISIK